MSTDFWNQLKHFNSMQPNTKNIPETAVVIDFDMFLKLIWTVAG